jgi:acetamidase/formamidase
MRRAFAVAILAMGFLAAQNMSAQSAQNSAANADAGISGQWIMIVDMYGTPANASMDLVQQGNKITGTLNGAKLEGTATGNSMHFVAKRQQGGTTECTATVQGDRIAGTIIVTDADDKEHPRTRQFTAKLAPKRHAGPAQRFEFTPTVFYRAFSPMNKPVLNISPGDTIHTTTVDAGGTDEKGVTRSLGGNPETGPFYIDSAMPGDALVVHIVRLKLNRDYAVSDDSIVDRGMDSNLAVKMKDAGNDVRWHLDLAHGTASPEKPGEHMKNYSVPVHPMLGCVATATNPMQAAPGSGDSGHFGGNMDFNEIVEGATVYLPVSVPGAMLYFGDGHAMQGDGELNGNALETSMDVEISVDLIPKKQIPTPRVESATHIMAMALEGSIDEAFRTATSSMAHWLEEDYKLTPSEIAQVLGTSAEYRVSEVADRNAGVVIKISKERLKGLGAGK